LRTVRTPAGLSRQHPQSFGLYRPIAVDAKTIDAVCSRHKAGRNTIGMGLEGKITIQLLAVLRLIDRVSHARAPDLTPHRCMMRRSSLAVASLQFACVCEQSRSLVERLRNERFSSRASASYRAAMSAICFSNSVIAWPVAW
jgi:hypothetical protein